MELCRQCEVDCIVCPCCNGKLGATIDTGKKDGGDETRFTYPRSGVFRSLISENEYALLSKAADDEFNYLAKCCIELDRGYVALEQGYEVTLLSMDPLIASPKHHIVYSRRNGKA